MCDTENCRHLPLGSLLEFVAHNAETDAEVADACNVTRRTVCRWKNLGGVRFHTADRVATSLGVHPSAIWGRDYWELGHG